MAAMTRRRGGKNPTSFLVSVIRPSFRVSSDAALSEYFKFLDNFDADDMDDDSDTDSVGGEDDDEPSAPAPGSTGANTPSSVPTPQPLDGLVPPKLLFWWPYPNPIF